MELQEFLHVEKLLMPATIHLATIHISTLFSCYFTLLLFLLQFFISSHFVLVIAFSFSFFFGNFLYTEHLYKSQSGQTITSLRQYREWAAVSPLLPFLHFLSFSFLFLGCQTPSKDDNLEDERLKHFFLGVKGHWAGDRRQLRVFLCFN